jgi:phosphoribosylaminoimidazolecarboxamide formyltransferase/IMP cyclohydrolase
MINGSAAAVVVKHTNPCGGAIASSSADAIAQAIAGDPVAAYGGILACSPPAAGSPPTTTRASSSAWVAVS